MRGTVGVGQRVAGRESGQATPGSHEIESLKMKYKYIFVSRYSFFKVSLKVFLKCVIWLTKT